MATTATRTRTTTTTTEIPTETKGTRAITRKEEINQE
jgi:hypothetical protein